MNTYAMLFMRFLHQSDISNLGEYFWGSVAFYLAVTLNYEIFQMFLLLFLNVWTKWESLLWCFMWLSDIDPMGEWVAMNSFHWIFGNFQILSMCKCRFHSLSFIRMFEFGIGFLPLSKETSRIFSRNFFFFFKKKQAEKNGAISLSLFCVL